MSGATVATEAIRQWLLLEADDPGSHDARNTVAALGVDVQRDASRRAADLRLPLADTTAHCADEGQIATALAALRIELDALDPNQAEADSGFFARVLSKVPGVGSPAGRYAKRLKSSRVRVTSILDSLEAGRGVLSRDNITLRADQERLVELSAALEAEAVNAQAFVDALEFAIDVELPFGDPRRPLFEDELMVTGCARVGELARAIDVSQQGSSAIESVMSSNRELIRGIDRTRELTLAGFATATASGAELARSTAAFGQIDTALSAVDSQRREALPLMERTVRDVTT